MPVERTVGGTSLIDVLDRVLDKGIVIDAWVRVSLVGIDLITVEARVVVASIDKAEQIGLDWWRYDRHLAPGRQNRAETERLRNQVRMLERQVAALSRRATVATRPAASGRRRRARP